MRKKILVSVLVPMLMFSPSARGISIFDFGKAGLCEVPFLVHLYLNDNLKLSNKKSLMLACIQFILFICVYAFNSSSSSCEYYDDDDDESGDDNSDDVNEDNLDIFQKGELRSSQLKKTTSRQAGDKAKHIKHGLYIQKIEK
jgi:hypothetical protein